MRAAPVPGETVAVVEVIVVLHRSHGKVRFSTLTWKAMHVLTFCTILYYCIVFDFNTFHFVMLHLDNVQAEFNINCSFPATDSAFRFTPLCIKTVCNQQGSCSFRQQCNRAHS